MSRIDSTHGSAAEKRNHILRNSRIVPQSALSRTAAAKIRAAEGKISFDQRESWRESVAGSREKKNETRRERYLQLRNFLIARSPEGWREREREKRELSRASKGDMFESCARYEDTPRCLWATRIRTKTSRARGAIGVASLYVLSVFLYFCIYTRCISRELNCVYP